MYNTTTFKVVVLTLCIATTGCATTDNNTTDTQVHTTVGSWVGYQLGGWKGAVVGLGVGLLEKKQHTTTNKEKEE